MLEHFKFALNVAFFVRHEYFLHPKLGNLQEVSRESVHIYTLEAKHTKSSAKHILWQLILALAGHLQAPFSDLTDTMGTLPPRSLSVSDAARFVFDAFGEPYRAVSDGINLVKRC